MYAMITDNDIRKLRTEAAVARDFEQVSLCDVALGDGTRAERESARRICEYVIREARARASE
jgi:hypothetical protein